MNLPHDKFCVLPWVSLETSPIGTVRPCCLAEDEIVDNRGVKFDLNSAEFQQIRNSEYMRELRSEFLSGNQPETCRKCWAEEDAGRTSKRMHTLERLKHIVQDTEWTDSAKPLKFLDLKLGNICNLKCRICGSWSSSTYAVEEIANDTSADPKQSFHYTMLQQGRWPRENPVFWEQIANSVDQLRYIEFTGGEPFMIEEHFELLRRLIRLGVAKKIEIHYNTNGTQFPEGAELIWREFRLVEIAFSIDDVEQRFEYQRSGAVWAEVESNLQRFKEMRQRNKNIQLQACCTINVFNVLYLESVARWLARQNFDFVYWNMMHEARHFSIGSLPEAVKFVAANRLRSADIPAEFRPEFDRIIDFMNNGESLDGELLRNEIARVDHRRKENLINVAPELARAIEYTNDENINTLS
jgi:MoaA/NifB/PqqE/SkfB family radical SAM enzyme